MTKAYLGLGSNLGDRLENLQEAVRRLPARDVRPLRSSRVYETEPVGGPEEQPQYLNAVIEVDTDLEPRGLLAVCLGIEDDMGRVRGERWGPRIIDLDVLTFGDDEVHEDGLDVPHPLMHERGFVLLPLLELDPDPPLPGGRRVSDVALPLGAVGGAVVHAPPLQMP
ncbi:MAG TPA: 2-amino-4-hydroxy-6-hydroxymethyldihydropteridine diphosphokinase [Actinomycetota bacterium]